MSANRILRRSKWRLACKAEKVPMPFQIFEAAITKTRILTKAEEHYYGAMFALRQRRKDKPKPPKQPYYVCAVKPTKPRDRAARI